MPKLNAVVQSVWSHASPLPYVLMRAAQTSTAVDMNCPIILAATGSIHAVMKYLQIYLLRPNNCNLVQRVPRSLSLLKCKFVYRCSDDKVARTAEHVYSSTYYWQ
jgi:hypothetical protein